MGNAVRVNGALYELVRPLAEGGFARVYEVRRDARRFALKWTRGVADGEQLQRLQLEIQVMRQLQLVRNVLPLEAAELRRSADGQKEALLLFPLVKNGSLQERLEQTAKRGAAAFTESECLGLFRRLLDAVAALHTLGFAHRDLKPGNVLLSDGEQNEPLLMDFGSVAPLCVKVRGQMDARKLWEDAATYSSAPYRAPELWSGGEVTELVDGRADVWSLGCVLYAMAFGPYSPFEHPRDGVQHLAIVNGYVSFPHGNMCRGQVFSATFTALIRWILTPEVAERPTLDGVRSCVYQLLNPAPRKQPSARVRRMSSRKKRLSVAEVIKSSKVPMADEQDWADFSAFEDPPSMSSELSFSGAVRSASSFSVSKPPLTNRKLSVKRGSVSLIDNGNPLALAGTRDWGLTDPERRRRLSLTGKQLWVSALEFQPSE